MARSNSSQSRNLPVSNLTEGAETPFIMEQGTPIFLSHESQYMDRVRDWIDDKVNAFGPPDPNVLMMVDYFYERLSYRDLGKRWRTSHETARRRIQNMIEEMREDLEEEYEWDATVE